MTGRDGRLVRARVAASLTFLLFGVALGALTSRIPAVKERLQLSDPGLSVALLAFAAGCILGMAVIGRLTDRWRNRGHSLGFGMGIALGYATLGQVGFEHRLEYAAIGSVTNLASRLCGEAKAGQIIVSRRVYGMVEQWVDAAPMDDLQLKGFNHPVLAMDILRWREEVDNVVDATAATATARRRK